MRPVAASRAAFFSEIAAMELGIWNNLNEQVILDCIDSINGRADCSDFDLVGLLGMAGRYIEEPVFPQALVGAAARLFPQLPLLVGRTGRRCNVLLVGESSDSLPHL